MAALISTSQACLGTPFCAKYPLPRRHPWPRIAQSKTRAAGESAGSKQVPKLKPKPQQNQGKLPADEAENSLEGRVGFELPDLGSLDGQRAWQGILAGVATGTVLGVGVPAAKAAFVAATVAAGWVLIPRVDIDNFSDEGPELPGEVLTATAAEAQNILEDKPSNKIDKETSLTLAVAALGAGSLVSLLAAKSLALLLVGSLGVIAIKRDDKTNIEDIGDSLQSSGTFLQRKGTRGPGVAAVLLLDQGLKAFSATYNTLSGSPDAGKTASDAPRRWNQPVEETREEIVAIVDAPATQQEGGDSLLADALKRREEEVADAPGSKQEGGNSLLVDALKRREQGANAPASKQQGSNSGLLEDALKRREQAANAPASKQEESNSGLLEDGLKRREQAANAPASKQEESESLLADALKRREEAANAPASKQEESNSGLLEDALKRREEAANAPASKQQGNDSGLLDEALKLREQAANGNGSTAGPSADKDSAQGKASDPSGSLLEDALKGRNEANQDLAANAGKVGSPEKAGGARSSASGTSAPAATPKRETLLEESLRIQKQLLARPSGRRSSGASKQAASQVVRASGKRPSKTPLEDLKGGDPSVDAKDLVKGKTAFQAPEKPRALDAGQAGNDGGSTPLQNVKGGNNDAAAGDLAKGVVGFKASEGVLQPGSKTADSSVPLQNLKGGNADASASDLVKGTTKFQPAQGALSPDSKAQQGAPRKEKTPLENLKGGGNGDTTESGLESLLNEALRLGEEAVARSQSVQEPTSRANTLGMTSSRAAAGPAQSNVLSVQQGSGLGKMLQLVSASARAAGAAVSAPFQPGKPASEQTPVIKPAMPVKPTPAMASKPSSAPPTQLTAKPPTPAPPPKLPALPSSRRLLLPPRTNQPRQARTTFSGRSSPVAGYINRARRANITPQQSQQASAPGRSPKGGNGSIALPPQKRTMVEKWLLAAGTGVVAGMVALVGLLVKGASVTAPVPKGILAGIFACMLAVVLLVSLLPKPGQPAPPPKWPTLPPSRRVLLPPRTKQPRQARTTFSGGSSPVAGYTNGARRADITPQQSQQASGAPVQSPQGGNSGVAIPPQKRTMVEKWLLAARTGVVAGMVALLGLLVNGASVTAPVPKGILAGTSACMLALVLLVSLLPKPGKKAAPAAA